LLADADRVRKEYESYAAELAAARRQHNATEELATRAVLFRHRGISLDTSLMPNYAIDDAIAALLRKDLLGPGTVRRVAIIGPGLDFVDKAEGYDFYPQQTIQPFAVIDSLLASGVSRDQDLQVTTLDISSRVNQHIAAARERARKGQGYTIQLAQDPAWHWTPVAQDYWDHFGSQIAKPAQAVAIPPELGDLKIRAVTVAPRYVLDVTPVDLDVVYQNLPLPPGERYDLVIATNILVYYDIFEQELAMANVARMLKPGGFLLSNNILEELPGSPLKGVGYSQTAYSDRPGDGDQIFWYQSVPEPAPPKEPSAPK
jgi:SAM-dependent methyltransferase